MAARIMLVEDEAVVALDQRMALEELGYEVVGAATTGRQAIEMARANRPDLMLMDISLRGGMDGVEAARSIREHQDIPLIFVTAHADDRSLARARELRPEAFILKPYTASTLRASIEIALYRHSAQQQVARSERRLRQITESLAEGLLVFDGEGCLTHMNAAAEQLLGWSKEQLTPMSFCELFPVLFGPNPSLPSDARLSPPALRTCRDQATELRRKDSQQLPVSMSVSALGGEDGGDGWVITFQDISQRKRHEADLLRLATRDALTGLHNRCELLRLLGVELERCRRHGQRLSLLLIDIDDFKSVNDSRGHAVGDMVLKRFAELAGREMRESDHFGRYGGEEFVVVLPHTARADGLALARRLGDTVACASLLDTDGGSVRVTLSIGLACWADDGTSVDELLRVADDAMYRAKRSGKNCTRMAAPSDGHSDS